MERICFEFNIFPGTEAAYEESHTNIWPEMADAIIDSGYRNYSLFRRDTKVICYGECIPTFAAAQKKMQDNYSELVARWNVSMEPFIEKMADENGNLLSYNLIWHLDLEKPLL